MDQKTYLKKFSRVVHWRLPKSEADEVLADYKELFSQCSEKQEDMPIQTLGEPVQAARLLSEPKVYHRWLAVFGLMAFCLLLCEFLLLRASFYHYPRALMYTLLILGLAVSLTWFRPRHGRNQKSPFPKRLFPMLLGLVTVMVVVAVVMVGLILQVWAFIPFALYGRIAHCSLLLAGTVGTIFGLFGLVKARLSDYRWCSLYVMGFTALVECVLLLAVLVALDVSSTTCLLPYVPDFGIVGMIGLVGVGVSLC